ncbi:MAG: DUF3604 domain-containing protein [Clostridia bacterium]|jgi:hypothetical protein|nr:DUF3604 domain-containing protein [Clostridia bacterium]MBT7122297.1 DUF3604 domain-containing protein [Clostridia bacterium]
MQKVGKANINIKEMTAGSSGCFTIAYETGAYGVDDSGEILIARRDVCDSAIPQFDDPNQSGFVKVSADVAAKVTASYVPNRYIRPFKSCISIKVSDGSLSPGDKIHVQYGSPSGEGAGYRIQTFAETEHLFKVLVDCAGSGNFVETDDQPYIKITGGYADALQIVVPSSVIIGDPFDVLVRAIDSFGNIAKLYTADAAVMLEGQARSVIVNNGIGRITASLARQGTFYFEVIDEHSGLHAVSNPIVCTEDAPDKTLYWGDMHGQTKRTVGTGTLDEYFSFGRDCAWLDFCAWQGNDFQVTDELWADVCKKVKQYHKPSQFVTFLGYEWSGTTPAGGDYNIYYLYDDQLIHRSYHWQIGMENTDGSDRSPITELWKQFKGREDVMAVPHVGGRYGNLDMCSKDLVHLLEIHSHHGTFEWFFKDALDKGLKLGVIAASDDHTCRPGLSYPTRQTSRSLASFDVIGGYTGVYADELTRESLWEAFNSRHTYGTTGERMILKVTSGTAMMGDEIFQNFPPTLDIEALATGDIMDIEIMRNTKTIYSYADAQPKNKNIVRILWSGVRSKSRPKKVKWDGSLSVQGGRIAGCKAVAFNQADEGVTQMSNQLVTWKSNTSGDIDGIELALDYDNDTTLTFSSPQTSFTIKMSELTGRKIIKQAGGINQQVQIDFALAQSSKQAAFSFTDGNIEKGVNAYWVKVTQADGNMAWSSPIYIKYKT